jgi:hypothetical protein
MCGPIEDQSILTGGIGGGRRWDLRVDIPHLQVARFCGATSTVWPDALLNQEAEPASFINVVKRNVTFTFLLHINLYDVWRH